MEAETTKGKKNLSGDIQAVKNTQTSKHHEVAYEEKPRGGVPGGKKAWGPLKYGEREGNFHEWGSALFLRHEDGKRLSKPLHQETARI